MKIQILVATVNQEHHDLVKKMKINTDAIIANQCNYNSVEVFDYKGNKIQYLNFSEKGVGLNRNNALMRATADICLFADDDMIYVDNYEKIVEKAFNDNPKADVIIFNLHEQNIKRKIIKKKTKVNYLNYLRYGTARIAIRLKPVKECGIYFNQCFGGGTEHCHGEDNIFLNACLKNKLKIIAIPEYIATLTEERESSWENGYNQKYLNDQGVLYYTLSRKKWKFLCLQDAIRKHNKYNKSFLKAYSLMLEGVKKHKKQGAM